MDALSGSSHNSVNSVKNMGIGPAAAEVATHEFADLGIGADMALSDQADSRNNLSRCAVTALESVMLDERYLQRV
jgi:hypothetical protein